MERKGCTYHIASCSGSQLHVLEPCHFLSKKRPIDKHRLSLQSLPYLLLFQFGLTLKLLCERLRRKAILICLFYLFLDIVKILGYQHSIFGQKF